MPKRFLEEQLGLELPPMEELEEWLAQLVSDELTIQAELATEKGYQNMIGKEILDSDDDDDSDIPDDEDIDEMSDKEIKAAAKELDLKVKKGLKGKKLKAWFKEECEELLIKSCEDGEKGSVIVIFSEANETSVKYSDFCLELSAADSQEMIKAVDKAIFMSYGVI